MKAADDKKIATAIGGLHTRGRTAFYKAVREAVDEMQESMAYSLAQDGDANYDPKQFDVRGIPQTRVWGFWGVWYGSMVIHST